MGNEQSLSNSEVSSLSAQYQGIVTPQDIRAMHGLWRKHAPKSGKMTEKDFEKFSLATKQPHQTAEETKLGSKQLFQFLDKDKSGTVEFDEFVMVLVMAKNPTAEILVDTYDENGDGDITEEELLKGTVAILRAKGQKDPLTLAKAKVKEVMDRVDVNKDGKLTRDEILADLKNNLGNFKLY